MEKVVDIIYDVKVRTASADQSFQNHKKVLDGQVEALNRCVKGTIEYAEAEKKLDNSIIAANSSTNKSVREMGAAANAAKQTSSQIREVGKGAADATRGLKQYDDGLKNTEKSTLSLVGKTTSLQSTLAKAGVAFGGLMIIKSVATTAFEAATSLEASTIAFTTMLKSREKAEKLLREITIFAEETPFQTDELERASKSLLAFGTDAKAIVPTLRMIGDISSGIGAPIGEIAELYGKAKVQGRLFAMDINQLTNRGIPIITELAKIFGVAQGKIKQMVEDGKVGFPELELAFQNMTKNGGQFEGLTKNMSESTKGLISTAKDNFEMLARSIFQTYQPTIKSALKDTIAFLKGIDPTQIKKMVNVGIDLVKAWIAYKIVLQTTAAAQRIFGREGIAQNLISGIQNFLIKVKEKNLIAATRAQMTFNAASKANPWGLILGILAAVVAYLVDFSSLMGTATDNVKAMSNADRILASNQELLGKVTKQVGEYVGEEIGQLNKLFFQLRSTTAGTDERKKAIDAINSTYGITFKNLKDEEALALEVSAAYEKLKDSIIKSAKARAANENITEISKSLIDLEIEIDRAKKKIGETAKETGLDDKALKQALANFKQFSTVGDEIIQGFDDVITGFEEADKKPLLEVQLGFIFNEETTLKQLEDQKKLIEAAIAQQIGFIDMDTKPKGTGGKGDKKKNDPLPGTIAALQNEISKLDREKTDLIKIFEQDGKTFNLDEFLAKVSEIEKRKQTMADLLTAIGGGEIYVPGKQTITEIQKQVDSLLKALDKIPPGWERYDELVKQLTAAKENLAKMEEAEFERKMNLQFEELNEEERHQVAILEIEKKHNGVKLKTEKDVQAKILEIQIEATKRKLALMKLEMDTKANVTEEELMAYKKVENALDELQKKRTHVYDKDTKEHKNYAQQWKESELGPKLDAINQVLQAALNAASQIIQANIQQIDALRSLQQQRVNDARDIADEGNAEMLALEEERLDKLNKKREEFVRQQQALAIVELIANSAVAVAKAAAEGGIAAPFTIAATLIALAAGLATAKALGSQGFKKGGYTGDGNPNEVSTQLGHRPFTYHKGEFVFDAETTHTGNNLAIFRNILKGRMDLQKVMDKRHILINHSGGMTDAKANELIKAIHDKPVPDFNFSDRGIFSANTKHENRVKRTRTRQE